MSQLSSPVCLGFGGKVALQGSRVAGVCRWPPGKSGEVLESFSTGEDLLPKSTIFPFSFDLMCQKNNTRTVRIKPNPLQRSSLRHKWGKGWTKTNLSVMQCRATGMVPLILYNNAEQVGSSAIKLSCLRKMKTWQAFLSGTVLVSTQCFTEYACVMTKEAAV